MDTKLPGNIFELDLSYNLLSTVPDSSLLPASLQSLSLKNNKIRSFSNDTLKFLQTLKVLTVGNNPITLNCTKTSTFEAIKNLNNIQDKRDMTLDIGNVTRPFLSIVPEDICPLNSKISWVFIALILSGCIILIVILGLVGNFKENF